MTWNEVDVSKEDYFHSITPRSRSYGIGSYGQDKMINLSSFRGSTGQVGTFGHHFANGGIVSGASGTQISALADKPSIFWNANRRDFISNNSSASFTNQNGDHYYSFWRLTDGSNIFRDFASGDHGSLISFNYDVNWDDQIFAVNGQGKGNTSNGSPLSKVVVPANLTDFSISRPLLMSLVGGLPRGGGDIVNKNEPVDAYHRVSHHDYYLNYYPKYDGTSKKLLAKDDGMDWLGLNTRTQIDGTQPVAQQAAVAASFATGYSRVVKNIIYMKLIL